MKPTQYPTRPISRCKNVKQIKTRMSRLGSSGQRLCRLLESSMGSLKRPTSVILQGPGGVGVGKINLASHEYFPSHQHWYIRGRLFICHSHCTRVRMSRVSLLVVFFLAAAVYVFFLSFTSKHNF